jgi:hypothetical protein
MADYMCTVCDKHVRDNQKAIYCDICNHWVHLACTALNKHDYTLLSVDDSHYYCPRCVVEIFPFNYIDETAEFLIILQIFFHDFPIFSRFMPNLHQFSILNNKKIINKDEIEPHKCI